MTGEIDRSWACDTLLWDGQPLVGRRPLRVDEIEVLSGGRRRWLFGLAIALITWPVLAVLPLHVPLLFGIWFVLLVWGLVLWGEGVECLSDARDRRHGFVYQFGEEPDCTRLLASGRLLEDDCLYPSPWWKAGVVGDLRRHLAGQQVAAAEAWFDAWAEPDGSGWFCNGLPQVACRGLSHAERADLAAQRHRAHLSSVWLLAGVPLAWVVVLLVSLVMGWPALVAIAVLLGLPVWLVGVSFHNRFETRKQQLDTILADGQVHGFSLACPSDGPPLRLELLGGGGLARIDGRAPDSGPVWHLWHGALPPVSAASLPDGSERALTPEERAELEDCLGRRRADPQAVRFRISLSMMLIGIILGSGTAVGWPLAGLGLLGLLMALVSSDPYARLRSDLASGTVTVRWETIDADGWPDECGPCPGQVRVERLTHLGVVWTWDEIPSPRRPLENWLALDDEDEDLFPTELAFYRQRPRPAADAADA